MCILLAYIRMLCYNFKTSDLYCTVQRKPTYHVTTGVSADFLLYMLPGKVCHIHNSKDIFIISIVDNQLVINNLAIQYNIEIMPFKTMCCCVYFTLG